MAQPARGAAGGLTAAYAVLAVFWLAIALAGGAALAALARRIHPSLSFRRLWIFYAALLGFFSAAVMAIGLF